MFLEIEPGDGANYHMMVSQPGGLGQPIYVVMLGRHGHPKGSIRLEFDQVEDWLSRVACQLESGKTAVRATLGDFYTQHVFRESKVAGIWEATVMILVGASVAFLGSGGMDLSVVGHLYRERLPEALVGLGKLVQASQMQSMLIHERRSGQE